MESPIPLYPTDCPPPYEAVMGQRAPSQVSVCSSPRAQTRVCLPPLTFFSVTAKATMFDPHGTELSGERGTSTAFSGEGERHQPDSSDPALLKLHKKGSRCYIFTE